MINAASARRRALRLLLVLALVTGVTGAIVVTAPAALAEVEIVPSLGDPIGVAGAIGNPDSNPDSRSACPAHSALTSVVGENSNQNWLTGIEPTCTELVGGSAVHLGTATAAPVLSGFRSTQQAGTLGTPGTTACPLDSVAVGVGGKGGGLAENLQLYCRALAPDGTLGTALQTATPTGPGVNGGLVQLICPTGSVVTELTGRLGQDITYVQVACSVLTTQRVNVLPDNTSWPHARTVEPTSSTGDQQLDVPGEQLWYKLAVQPGSQLRVGLTGLTNNLDLAVFKDIGQSFDRLTSTQDLTHLSAEFAGDAFAPSVFSPSVFSPSVFSPSVFSPSVFSPSVFSPSVFSPSVFSPSVFSPSVFSPSVFSPSVFSPSVFSPSVFSPSVFSGGTPDQQTLSDAFSSAQVRSLVAVSANDGTAPESVDTDTWGNTGYYYVRVTGRNGATSPFSLTVDESGGPCGAPLEAHASDVTIGDANGSTPQTVILTDSHRMPMTDELTSALTSFAGQVGGALVDVGQSVKVGALNAQADTSRACPYAKNLVAQAIRDIVNTYRSPSLKYVVIVGDDSIIPFFRYADTAGLGPENGYFPPMSDQSASQASLRTNTVLGQDAYGSAVDVSIKGTTLPVPDLAVGRLVEKQGEITATLNRYASTPVIRPTSTLATGYDFLADAARGVAGDFAEGDPQGRNDTLITNQDVPTTTTTVDGVPDANHSWTATDLGHALLGSRHDVVFLAGHFSANSALAADYSTSLLTTDLAASTTDFANSLVFSAGCHSGYNIVDQDGVPGVTLGLDWAQAFAQKGATLVAGTGYQYGDTDFVAYSEKLYGLMAHDLRAGAAGTPVAVGTALAQAKQDYLSGLTAVGGIDQKSLLEATLFGLPMQGVDFAGRIPTPSTAAPITPTAVAGGPGARLGLTSAPLSVDPIRTTANTVPLNTVPLNSGTVHATYLAGTDGVVNAPGAPTLPLQSVDVSAAGTVLRGVGFRSGTYTDDGGIVPLTGAATTEQSAAHVGFSSPAFYPNRVAVPNYFGALSGGGTTLNVTPAQYRSDGGTAPGGAVTSTQRSYSALGLQLFYSANVQTYGANTPALAAAPSISGVQAGASGDGSTVHVETHVVGDPSAGIQQAWVTYTGTAGSALHGSWQSADLTQDPVDSTLWTGDIAVPDGHAGAVRFLVQAANGVGEVGVDDNVGDYYAAGVTPGVLPSLTATTLTLDPPQAGPRTFGGTLAVGATLTDAQGAPLPGRAVLFGLGASGVTATTGSDGHATAALPLTSVGPASLVASWAGDATTAPSSTAPLTVTVAKRPTALMLVRNADGSFRATLTDGSGTPLPAQTVTLVASSGATTLATVPATTGGDGTALFPSVAPGADAVQARFGDQPTPSYLPSSSLSLAGAAVTIGDAPGGSSIFGTATTFTVGVAAQVGNSAPTGTVQVTVDGTVVGTLPLSHGSATITTKALLPGPHTIVAGYSGDSADLPRSTTASHQVTCGRTYSGTVKGSLSFTGKTSVCIADAVVGGSVSVASGVPLAVIGSTVVGAVTAKGGGQLMICGSAIQGTANVDSATGLVVVGDRTPSNCAPNRIRDALVLKNDLAGVRAIGNTVPLVTTKSIGGPGPYPDFPSAVTDNHA